MTVTQSDKGLAKIAEGASSRRHAETSPVKVKDTHLMNNKLPPAEILCGDCGFLMVILRKMRIVRQFPGIYCIYGEVLLLAEFA